MIKDRLFKRIDIGGITESELIKKLVDSGIQFNEYATTLLESSYFKIDDNIKTVDLARVNLSDLQINSPCSFQNIVENAYHKNLTLCPLYLAAFLRLEFLEQSEGPYLTIASEKPIHDEGYPNGFYLRNIENTLWLRGYRADADYLWPIESEFIFICSNP